MLKIATLLSTPLLLLFDEQHSGVSNKPISNLKPGISYHRPTFKAISEKARCSVSGGAIVSPSAGPSAAKPLNQTPPSVMLTVKPGNSCVHPGFPSDSMILVT